MERLGCVQTLGGKLAICSEIKSRFEEKFIPEPNSGCWLWTAAADQHGYGRFRVGSLTDNSRRMTVAPRMAWELYKGELPPPDLDVCHSCDNPPCVNPDHLFLGTRLQNMQDCVKKGRNSRGESHSKIQKAHILSGPDHYLYGRPGRKGEKHHMAKLTDDDVRAIRADHRMLAEIAADYEVSFATIGYIRRGKTWKHVL